MKIIVMVKQVPDTWGDRLLNEETGFLQRSASDPIIDEISERALEVALRRKDNDKRTQVVAMTMGPQGAFEILRKALAMGADTAVHITDERLTGADIALTARALAAAARVEGFDLIIAGNESTDGQGGLTPAMLAAHLRAPLISGLESIEITDSTVSGTAVTEHGTLDAEAALPAVVSITERIADPRFPSFRGIMAAKRKPVTVLGLADLELTEPAARTVIASVTKRPDRQSGTKILDDGTAGTVLAEYLTSSRLA